MIPLSDDPGRRRSFPLVNILLIAANIWVFFAYELAQPSERALNQLILAAGVVPVELLTGHDLGPRAPLGSIYATLFTSMFLHGGLVHLGGNMLFLWVFGDNVEDAFGHLPYLFFYLICGLAASLTHVFLNASSTVPSVGASGAIAGVLAAYLVLYPHARIRTLLFIPPFILLPRLSAMFLIGFWFPSPALFGAPFAGYRVRADQRSSGLGPRWRLRRGLCPGPTLQRSAASLRLTGSAAEGRRF